MSWKLKESLDGDITDKDIVEVYTLLSCSVSDKHQALAKRLECKYQLAKLNLEAVKVWESEGGSTKK